MPVVVVATSAAVAAAAANNARRKRQEEEERQQKIKEVALVKENAGDNYYHALKNDMIPDMYCRYDHRPIITDIKPDGIYITEPCGDRVYFKNALGETNYNWLSYSEYRINREAEEELARKDFTLKAGVVLAICIVAFILYDLIKKEKRGW